MNIPELKIGSLVSRLPVIQGGMGIGVSGSRLAGAVAAGGAIGIISGVQIGYREPDFNRSPLQANLRALRREIKNARQLARGGIIGVNFMVAMTHYREMVQAAVEEGIDLIISGAGLPLELPSLVKGSSTAIVPIVSSGKAAKVLVGRYSREGHLPDALVVEGPLAGGHLGFAPEQLEEPAFSLEKLLQDVLATVRSLNLKIPVIAAGGLRNGRDIARMLQLGAAGAQLGTVFVATQECDADPAFKEAYLSAAPEDVEIIRSPVGLPGRAVSTPFTRKMNELGTLPVKRCFNCLTTCNPATTPYCISQALIDAVQGEDGLVFCGANVGDIHEIVPVASLLKRLEKEIREAPEEP